MTCLYNEGDKIVALTDSIFYKRYDTYQVIMNMGDLSIMCKDPWDSNRLNPIVPIWTNFISEKELRKIKLKRLNGII